MNNIYIVEDDENIRDLVEYALNANGFNAHPFESAVDFFEQIKNLLPDLILLDIMLPDTDGLTILKKLRDNPLTKTIPVIMLTAKSSEYDKVKGLDLGADDYITKPFSVLELISRIKAALRRSNKFDKVNDDILIYKNITLDTNKHIVLVNKDEIYLTLKEFDLLKYLITNAGFVLSRDKIMERVWGFDYEGESRTVDMHIKTLRQKLGNSSSIIETVRGVGYKAL